MNDIQIPDWNKMIPVSVTGAIKANKDDTILIPTSDGTMVLSLHDHGIRLKIGGARPTNQYGILLHEPTALPARIDEQEHQTLITSGDTTLIIEHSPFSFELIKDDKSIQRSSTDGHFERRFRLPPLANTEMGWLISLDLQSNEPVYGLGEKWGKLDKRGQLVRSHNQDALGVNAEISYKNTPFAWSPQGWGVLIHTPAPVTHSIGYAPWSQRSYVIVVEDDTLDLFLFTGKTGADLLGAYTALTGRAPVPPLWSLGVILSKAYYETAAELLSTAAEVRKKGMPCDVITIDGRAWQDTDTRFLFEWDPTRYPDPAKVIKKLKDQNFKICIWEYPMVSLQNPSFQKLADNGYFLKDKRTGKTFEYEWDQQAFGDVLSPLPKSGIIDFTNPDAYNFWRECHKDLFDLGIDMIKADFGEQVSEDMVASNGETGHALHNIYAMLYNRCVYESAKKYAQNGPFLFSRSAWTGSQRYPSQWGGDPQANWGGMAANIRGGLSWGMSGAPFYATDIGGFYRDERNPKLYVRWAQAGVFSAHMRLHGIGPREPWSYSKAAERAVMKALELRYEMIPYLMQVIKEASETGMPVQRAMALSHPEERAAWAFEDQYMLGSEMLIAPCLNEEDTVEVYLPQGNWNHFQTGKKFTGGQSYKFTLGLEEMAVFVREGAKIPLGPKVQHTEMLNGAVQIERYWSPEE